MEDIGKFDDDGLWVSENPNGFVLFLERHANKRAGTRFILKCLTLKN